ncbi:UNVERIFIED_CONTAM: hypothetical protein GTU68_038412 [Idotea baltica]|nr:hypothetical protein [Idotea baltica]
MVSPLKKLLSNILKIHQHNKMEEIWGILQFLIWCTILKMQLIQPKLVRFPCLLERNLAIILLKSMTSKNQKER